MAICRIIDTDVTPEQYEQVRDKLGVRESPPAGGQLHVAAKGDNGKMRIIEVWDTREQAEAFGDRVLAVRKEMGIGGDSMPPTEYLELHTLMTPEHTPA
jgi:hypothetical protein